MHMTRSLARCAAALVGIGIILGVSSASWAAPFTGPISPYYLDNYNTDTIYVVQGTSVINSFPWAYGAGTSGCPSGAYCEGGLAVTNVVSTTWFGNFFGAAGTAGEYSLSGTPIGSWSDTPPLAGESTSEVTDGTSDGTSNYAVEYQNSNGTENVIVTNLDWQNPTVLFQICSCSEDYSGIAYDPANNSLWISGYFLDTISDYSLTGTLLSSFTTGLLRMTALGFDPADGTLWFSNHQSSTLYQYSTSGTLLQDGTPSGLPSDYNLSGDFAEVAPSSIPEPSSLVMFGTALAGVVSFGAVKRRKRKTA